MVFLEKQASDGGTFLADGPGMVVITLWRAGPCECLLLMGERTVELRLMKDHAVIRRSEPTTTKVALRMAAAWKWSLASATE